MQLFKIHLSTRELAHVDLFVSIGMERYMFVYVCRSKFKLEETYVCGYFCHNDNS